MCAKNASVANKQTSAIFVGAHTSEQKTHHFHFTLISSTLSSWAFSSTLLLHTQPASRISLCHTSQRLLHFIGQWKHENKLKVSEVSAKWRVLSHCSWLHKLVYCRYTTTHHLSQLNLHHTSHRVGCTSLNTAINSTNWRWVKIEPSEKYRHTVLDYTNWSTVSTTTHHLGPNTDGSWRVSCVQLYWQTCTLTQRGCSHCPHRQLKTGHTRHTWQNDHTPPGTWWVLKGVLLLHCYWHNHM